MEARTSMWGSWWGAFWSFQGWEAFFGEQCIIVTQPQSKKGTCLFVLACADGKRNGPKGQLRAWKCLAVRKNIWIQVSTLLEILLWDFEQVTYLFSVLVSHLWNLSEVSLPSLYQSIGDPEVFGCEQDWTLTVSRERVLTCILRHRAVEYNWAGPDFQRQVRMSPLPGSCMQVKRIPSSILSVPTDFSLEVSNQVPK